MKLHLVIVSVSVFANTTEEATDRVGRALSRDLPGDYVIEASGPITSQADVDAINAEACLDVCREPAPTLRVGAR